MKPIQVEREIFRYEQGAFKHIEDSIVTEFPVTIKMNGQEFVTMVSTPEYIEDMVIGFLASEESFGSMKILMTYGYKRKKDLYMSRRQK